jgi:hypothetical protein
MTLTTEDLYFALKYLPVFVVHLNVLAGILLAGNGKVTTIILDPKNSDSNRKVSCKEDRFSTPEYRIRLDPLLLGFLDPHLLYMSQIRIFFRILPFFQAPIMVSKLYYEVKRQHISSPWSP